jgi:hypothetical protein
VNSRLHHRLPWIVLGVAGLVAPLFRGQSQGEGGLTGAAHAGEGGGRAAAEALREECFVLEQVAEEGRSSGGRDEAPQVVGVARCRRLLLDEGWQLEWDVHFLEEQTRVLHVERWSASGVAMIWRELRPRSGRTVTAQWSDEGRALLVREWGGPQRVEVEVPAPGGGVLPLGLLELAREGVVEGGVLRTFDPLARAFEPLRMSQALEVDGTRRVELRREDGTQAATWWLDGEGLSGFCWQGGGLRARRVGAGEYEERLQPAPPPEPVADSR